MPALSDLIDILARADALWTPWRRWDSRLAVTAVYERRHEYQRSGVPLVGGGTGAERVAAWRDRHDLAGLAELRSNRGRVYAKLVDAVDWQLRAACGLFGYGPMLTAIQRILDVEATGHVTGSGIAEIALLGMDGWSTENTAPLFGLEEALLPALTRGYVTSHSDTLAHVGYYLTDSGRQFLQRPGDEPANLPAYDPEAAECYTVRYCEKIESMKTATPEGRDLVIPLGAGDWDWPVPPLPSIFLRNGRVRRPRKPRRRAKAAR
jgi:hypothetical protein